jgi:uncharacterized protein YkwD
MKRFTFLATVFTAVLVLVLPFVGGGGPGLTAPAVADSGSATPLLASIVQPAVVIETPRVANYQRIDEAAIAAEQKAEAAALAQDWEHLAQKPVPKPIVLTPAQANNLSPAERAAYRASVGLPACPTGGGGGTSGAPGASSAQGVAGTTSDDLASFAATYNAIRIANCLDPVRYFVYDSCMEARLFWMAESPSPDPLDAWGHMGSTRIDGVPSVGCDGNLAGGSGNTGATVAQKWWASSAHRASLYRPGSSVAGACIAFAMTHGGIDEPYSFTRAAARWTSC